MVTNYVYGHIFILNDRRIVSLNIPFLESIGIRARAKTKRIVKLFKYREYDIQYTANVLAGKSTTVAYAKSL